MKVLKIAGLFAMLAVLSMVTVVRADDKSDAQGLLAAATSQQAKAVTAGNTIVANYNAEGAKYNALIVRYNALQKAGKVTAKQKMALDSQFSSASFDLGGANSAKNTAVAVYTLGDTTLVAANKDFNNGLYGQCQTDANNALADYVTSQMWDNQAQTYIDSADTTLVGVDSALTALGG
jgi:hypothetical protein